MLRKWNNLRFYLAGKSQPWKQGIKSQDKHIQKFIDSKVGIFDNIIFCRI